VALADVKTSTVSGETQSRYHKLQYAVLPAKVAITAAGMTHWHDKCIVPSWQGGASTFC